MCMDAKQEGASARILIVDDEVCISELLTEMLMILGHTAEACNDPASALALLEKNEFDLILSDFRMPGMNGEQFYAAVLKKSPHLANRIVFLTGDTANQTTQTFLKSIGNYSLAKPFQFTSVSTLISDVLAERGEAIAA